MLKVGQVVLVDDKPYVVEPGKELGGNLNLVPIMLDASRETMEVSSDSHEEILDYATRRPVR